MFIIRHGHDDILLSIRAVDVPDEQGELKVPASFTRVLPASPDATN